MGVNRQIHIYIVDDNRLVRNGLKALLADYDELEVIGTAADSKQALTDCEKFQPDTILMEVALIDGLKLIKQLCDVTPDSQIIVLTYKQDHHPVFAAIQAGVVGYLLKDMSTEDLVDAIIETSNGKRVIAQEVIPELVQQTKEPSVTVGSTLTNREREILSLMPEGLTNKELARQLHVSTSTIKNHISNILTKLQVDSRVSAVAIALRHNLVE